MSITRNFIFSAILTASSYIFPFIIFPYVSRILGPDNIGACDFVDSLINYFMLVSTLGVSWVGIREIASCRDDREKLNRVFTSLVVITSVSTFVAAVLLVAFTCFVPSFAVYRPLLFIGLLKLVGNFFLIEWFYRGLEDFKYITVRTILVKIGYMAGVFMFVRTASDYSIYYFLLCAMVVVNAIVNCWKAAGIVRLDFTRLQIRPFLKPLFVFCLYFGLSTMYTTFNTTYLGIVGDDTQVGYFATANKFFGVIISIYAAFTGVMMPRLTSLNAQNEEKEFHRLISLSYDVLMMFAFPILIFGIIFADQLVMLFAGGQYGGAVIPMRIMMPLVLIIGYEQIIVLQILAPKKKDRAIFTNALLGSIVGVVLNIVLVPGMLVVGTSITWVCAEIVVMLSAQYFVWRYTGLGFPFRMLMKYVIAYLPMAVIEFIIFRNIQIGTVGMIMTGFVVMAIYMAIVQCLVLKTEATLFFEGKIVTFFKNRCNIGKGVIKP